MLEKPDSIAQLLCSCASSGDMLGLRLLASPSNVDVPHMGLTPLMSAAAAFNDSGAGCLQLLLRMGANPHLTSLVGRSAMHLAASCGNVNCLRLLHARDKTLKDKENWLGQTPIMVAVASDSAKTVRRMLTWEDSRWHSRQSMKQRQQQLVLSKVDPKLTRLISHARKFHAWSCFVMLVRDCKDFCLTDQLKRHLLKRKRLAKKACCLAASGDFRQLESMLDNEIARSRWESRTPLMHACMSECGRKCVELLLRVGGSDSACDSDSRGWQASHFAAKYDNVDALKLLCQANDKAFCCFNDDKETPLMVATRENSKRAVLVMLSVGSCGIGARNAFGNCALDLAEGLGRVEVARAIRSAKRFDARAAYEMEKSKSTLGLAPAAEAEATEAEATETEATETEATEAEATEAEATEAEATEAEATETEATEAATLEMLDFL